MCQQNSEGADRPLGEAMPKTASQRASAAVPSPSSAPQPFLRPVPTGLSWSLAAIGSLLLAVFYVRWILFGYGFPGAWGAPVFSILFLVSVCLFARSTGRRAGKEFLFWALCVIAVSFSFPHSGTEWDIRYDLAFHLWHLIAVWFTLSRCGMLTDGKTGSLFPADLLSGYFILPFGSFFLRARVLFSTVPKLFRGKKTAKRIGIFLLSLISTILLCLISWNLLSAADPTFAAWGSAVIRWWQNLSKSFSAEWIVTLILSIPVGQWLFGLVGGSLRRGLPCWNGEVIRNKAARCRILPALSGWLLFGGLCLVYALFFTAQTVTCFTLTSAPGFTVFDACDLAVQGFWQLCGVMLLSLSVLALWSVFSADSTRASRSARILIAVFTAFTLAFAVLAAVKLGIYIFGYGITPKRALAAWWISVLSLCSVLSLFRLSRKLPAVRWTAWYAAASFTLLCLLPL